MKIIYASLLACFCLLAFTACNNDDKDNAPEFKNVTYTPRADDAIVGQGIFVKIDSAIEVTGNVIIYKNSFQHVLRIENFMIDNGPGIKVYLTKESYDLSDNINLGDLIAASGNFNYVYSVNTDMSLYKYIMIYSEKGESILAVAAL